MPPTSSASWKWRIGRRPSSGDGKLGWGTVRPRADLTTDRSLRDTGVPHACLPAEKASHTESRVRYADTCSRRWVTSLGPHFWRNRFLVPPRKLKVSEYEHLWGKAQKDGDGARGAREARMDA